MNHTRVHIVDEIRDRITIGANNNIEYRVRVNLWNLRTFDRIEEPTWNNVECKIWYNVKDPMWDAVSNEIINKIMDTFDEKF